MSPFTFKFLKQGIAITLTLCLIGTSGGIAQAALEAPTITRPAQPEFSPPAALGRIIDSFTSTQPSAPRVILIQDLHAHYGVQKNIAGILDFLDNKLRTAAIGNGGHQELRPSETAAIGSFIKKNYLSPPLPIAAVSDGRLSRQPSLSFALAVEGAAGPIDSSVMALFPDEKIKQAAADYLMREGELTGAEYFAVMRGLPQALTGVEDLNYYTLHRDLFRKTLSDRTQLVHTLKIIQGDLIPLRKRLYSRRVKHLQKKIEAFEKGDLSAYDYISYLASQASDYSLPLEAGYPLLAHFLQNPSGGHEAKLDYVFFQADELAFRLKLAHAKKGPEKDLVQVEHDLALLLRVADLQATELEVRDFGPRLNQFVALAKSLTGESQSGGYPFDDVAIRRLISSSIDYYVMALMRNQPMVDNTLALIDTSERRQPGAAATPERRHTRTSAKGSLVKKSLLSLPLGNAASPDSRPSGLPPYAVLVAGGFHTAPITQILREKNVSYVVISPAVDRITDADHALYVKRLNGQLLTTEEILADVGRISSPQPWWTSVVGKLSGQSQEGLAVGLFAGVFFAGYASLDHQFLTAAFAHRAALLHQTLPDYLPRFTQNLGHYSGHAQQIAQDWLKNSPGKWVSAAATGTGTAVVAGLFSSDATSNSPRRISRSPILGALIAILGISGVVSAQTPASGSEPALADSEHSVQTARPQDVDWRRVQDIRELTPETENEIRTIILNFLAAVHPVLLPQRITFDIESQLYDNKGINFMSTHYKAGELTSRLNINPTFWFNRKSPLDVNRIPQLMPFFLWHELYHVLSAAQLKDLPQSILAQFQHLPGGHEKDLERAIYKVLDARADLAATAYAREQYIIAYGPLSPALEQTVAAQNAYYQQRYRNALRSLKRDRAALIKILDGLSASGQWTIPPHLATHEGQMQAIAQAPEPVNRLATALQAAMEGQPYDATAMLQQARDLKAAMNQGQITEKDMGTTLGLLLTKEFNLTDLFIYFGVNDQQTRDTVGELMELRRTLSGILGRALQANSQNPPARGTPAFMTGETEQKSPFTSEWATKLGFAPYHELAEFSRPIQFYRKHLVGKNLSRAQKIILATGIAIMAAAAAAFPVVMVYLLHGLIPQIPLQKLIYSAGALSLSAFAVARLLSKPAAQNEMGSEDLNPVSLARSLVYALGGTYVLRPYVFLVGGPLNFIIHLLSNLLSMITHGRIPTWTLREEPIRKRLSEAAKELIRKEPLLKHAGIHAAWEALTTAFPNLAQEAVPLFGNNPDNVAAQVLAAIHPYTTDYVPPYENPEILKQLQDRIANSGNDRWLVVITGAGEPRQGKTTLFTALEHGAFPLGDPADIRFIELDQVLQKEWIGSIQYDPEVQAFKDQQQRQNPEAVELLVQRLLEKYAGEIYRSAFIGTRETLQQLIRTTLLAPSYIAQREWLRSVTDRITVINGMASRSAFELWQKSGEPLPYDHVAVITTSQATANTWQLKLDILPADGNRSPNLHVIGIGKEVPVSPDVEARWQEMAANQPTEAKLIASRSISAKFIVDPDMPAGTKGSYIYTFGGDVIIVTREAVIPGSGNIAEEAAFHEGVENQWEQTLVSRGLGLESARKAAHILAAAEEVIAFGKDDITPSHREDLASMSEADKQVLRDETLEQRKEQHDLIRKELGAEVLKQVLAYEARIQDAAALPTPNIFKTSRGVIPDSSQRYATRNSQAHRELLPAPIRAPIEAPHPARKPDVYYVTLPFDIKTRQDLIATARTLKAIAETGRIPREDYEWATTGFPSLPNDPSVGYLVLEVTARGVPVKSVEGVMNRFIGTGPNADLDVSQAIAQNGLRLLLASRDRNLDGPLRSELALWGLSYIPIEFRSFPGNASEPVQPEVVPTPADLSSTQDGMNPGGIRERIAALESDFLLFQISLTTALSESNAWVRYLVQISLSAMGFDFPIVGSTRPQTPILLKILFFLIPRSVFEAGVGFPSNATHPSPRLPNPESPAAPGAVNSSASLLSQIFQFFPYFRDTYAAKDLGIIWLGIEIPGLLHFALSQSLLAVLVGLTFFYLLHVAAMLANYRSRPPTPRQLLIPALLLAPYALLALPGFGIYTSILLIALLHVGGDIPQIYGAPRFLQNLLVRLGLSHPVIPAADGALRAGVHFKSESIEFAAEGNTLMLTLRPSGQIARLEYEEGRIYTVGRGVVAVDVRLEGKRISRKQLEIQSKNGIWSIRHIGTTNPTFRSDTQQPLSTEWVPIETASSSLTQRREALIAEARLYNINLRITRNLDSTALEGAEMAMETIREMGDLLKKAQNPITLSMSVIKNRLVLGQAEIGDTIGVASAGLTQHMKWFGGGLNPAILKQTIAHELLHKLSTVPDSTGKDLVMPIADWIALFEIHGMNTAVISGQRVDVKDYLDVSKHDFKTVTDRIRRLRGKNFSFLTYTHDPHEIVSWHGTGRPFGFGAFGKARKTLALLQKNLLRAGFRIYHFDPKEARWLTEPIPAESSPQENNPDQEPVETPQAVKLHSEPVQGQEKVQKPVVTPLPIEKALQTLNDMPTYLGGLIPVYKHAYLHADEVSFFDMIPKETIRQRLLNHKVHAVSVENITTIQFVEGPEPEQTASDKNPPSGNMQGGFVAGLAIAADATADPRMHSLYQTALQHLPARELLNFFLHSPFMTGILIMAVVLITQIARHHRTNQLEGRLLPWVQSETTASPDQLLDSTIREGVTPKGLLRDSVYSLKIRQTVKSLLSPAQVAFRTAA